MSLEKIAIRCLIFGALGSLSVFAPAAAQESLDLEISAVRVGFNNVYKLGCWTQIEVQLRGGDKPYTGVIEVTTRDPDGVPNSVFTPPDRPVGIVPAQSTAARLFVRPGQDGAALDVRFLDDTGRERAKRSFIPNLEPGSGEIPYGKPAASRLVAVFGSRRGINELVRDQGSSTDDPKSTHVVRLDTAADLPIEWYGYEGIDLLVLSGNQPDLYRPLAAGSQRIIALERWIELGGRLVIFCGANAPELLGPGGPLASLIPGKYDTLATLREPQPIEAYSGADSPVPGAKKDFRLEVPRLTAVEGRVLAYSGPSAADLPLVIRARRGLGEITFVGVDPDVSPLADWSGRTSLLRQALQWPGAPAGAENQDYASNQSEELIDRLRRALDESFVGVKTAPFGLVALLVIGYILLIGPGDYFFVKRFLKRMELTWLTFPLIVVAVSTGAYWAAHYMKGDQLRVNQVEIVDVDLGSNQARGTVWTHFFSPRVERYDLRLAPRFAEKPIASSEPSEPGRPDPGAPASSPAPSPQPPSSLVGWLGSSGYGLDGMRGRRSQTGLFDRGYAFSPPLDQILGLPVQEWSTKTLVGRWSAGVDPALEADLQSGDNDLLSGHITNRMGVALEDCVIMHANWAYKLPTLASGGAASIDDSLQPTSVITALTAETAEPAGASAPAGAPRLRTDTLDVPQLVKAMMFHDALGGAMYAQSSNRYQAFIDLSRLLKGDQAILLARVANGGGTDWVNGESPLTANQDRRWVYYRFIIPLKKTE